MSTDLLAPVRIATRRSELALWQSHWVRDRLREHWGERLQVELVEVVTQGDKILDRPLAQVGGKGLFVNELEHRLAAGEADIAVHSMKDLPAQCGEGLAILCTPEREDPRDALVGPECDALHELPKGTRVGTSSLRRAALVLRANPELEIVSIRGNVPTRIRKIEEGVCDYVVLAAAGLKRLGREQDIALLLEPESFVPAACQGTLAIEGRVDDPRMSQLLAPLNDTHAQIRAAAERAFLARLEGGCQVPMGCYAWFESAENLTVIGLVAGEGGRPCFTASKDGPPEQAAELGVELAETLLRLGAGEVLARLADASH